MARSCCWVSRARRRQIGTRHGTSGQGVWWSGHQKGAQCQRLGQPGASARSLVQDSGSKQLFQKVVHPRRPTETPCEEVIQAVSCNRRSYAVLPPEETAKWYSSLLQNGTVPETSPETRIVRLQANMAAWPSSRLRMLIPSPIYTWYMYTR